MDGAAARRSARMIGIGSGAIGLGLLVRPRPAGEFLGITHDRALQVIGLADVALAPGLIKGEPRAPWIAGRVGLNLLIARYLLAVRGDSSKPSRLLLGAVALAAVSVGDARIGAALVTSKD